MTYITSIVVFDMQAQNLKTYMYNLLWYMILSAEYLFKILSREFI